jgi:hypothetical protein
MDNLLHYVANLIRFTRSQAGRVVWSVFRYSFLKHLFGRAIFCFPLRFDKHMYICNQVTNVYSTKNEHFYSTMLVYVFCPVADDDAQRNEDHYFSFLVYALSPGADKQSYMYLVLMV